MSAWKRDFASGLVIVVPILVTAFVVGWLYARVASLTPAALVSTELLTEAGIEHAVLVAEFLRVVLTLSAFVVIVFAVGYLMRTTVGGLVEAAIDNLANRLPGLRVVYNASKMAAETALGGTEELQAPVKIETWNGLRMTAFKTGKTTADGREILFLPTAPNITTGFVIEVEPDQFEETDESVEDALTRILSAGFGDADRMGGAVDIEDLTGEGSDTG